MKRVRWNLRVVYATCHKSMLEILEIDAIETKRMPLVDMAAADPPFSTHVIHAMYLYQC
jgi:hypothetical protein